jgi:hypothetical protein
VPDYSEETNSTQLELTERFDRVLLYLKAKGGEYQRALPDFGAEVGLPEKTLGKILRRAEKHGIIRITKTSHPIIGVGRLPNTYKLLCTPESWFERRHDYFDGLAVKRGEVAIAREAEAKRAKLVARGVEAEKQRVLERRAGVTPTVPPPPVRSGDLDVEAWIDAFDFD